MASVKEDVILDYDGLRERLAFYAEDEYREFITKGIPSERPFIGVRVPIIRRLVDLISVASYGDFLTREPIVFEEVLARGMIICKMPYLEMLGWFDSQIAYIDDWCTCDTFCSGVCKKIGKHREEFLETKVEKLLDSDTEFVVRAGLVILKCAYVDFDYLAVIFDRAEKLGAREEYYIRMAIAWLVAECFIKYPEATLGYMQVSRLPKWVYNKAISKICDSYRVDEEMKEVMRGMRNKNRIEGNDL